MLTNQLGSFSFGYVIAFLILGLMVAGVFIYAFTVTKNEAQIKKRLNKIEEHGYGYGDYAKKKEKLEKASSFEKIVIPVSNRMAKLMLNLTPKKKYEELNKKLVIAGNPKNITANEFLGIQGIFMFIAPLFFLIFQIIIGSSFANAFFLSIVMGFAGYVMPKFWLSKAVTNRQEKIRKTLPFTLDLLNVSVDAGLGFDSAMDKVSQTLDGPLPEELGRVLSEIRLGKTRKEALRNMVERTEVKDLNQFVVAVIQAEKLGVGMSKLLRVQSKQMRLAAKQRAQEKAFKAPVKMLFPMVLFIFPSIFVVLLGPAMLYLPTVLGSF